MQHNANRPVLISPATRRVFREIAPGIVLREIDGLWQDEGFAPGPYPEDLSGERRSQFQSYLNAVDWTDRGHVQRALRVFERLLVHGGDLDAIRKELDRDGYILDNNGRITPKPTGHLRDSAIAATQDPSAIRDHLERIARAVADEDPAQVIGSAKELIESTAKIVLVERGLPVNDKDDLPKLVLQAEQALLVHPTNHAPGPDGSDAVRKILGGATTVTAGIAELRNRGFGTGHGQAGKRVGLGARHAHLAFNGARTWCEFILDTLADPDAPWHGQT
ncbi:abortive infection family protein [Nocardia salmonicida]|uniref:abortive infection family protein n=1 Tax=Nocardia salmonicida TaxID=53431 RepID=UPI0033DEFB1A